MRVLVIYPKFYVYGGGEILVVRLCNYLSRQGIKNSILTTEMMPEIRADLAGTEVITEKVRGEATSVRARYKMELEALARGVKKYQGDFDIINPHNFPSEIAAASGAKPIAWMCNEPELYLLKDHPNFKTSLSLDRLYLLLLFLREKFLVKKHIRHVIVSDEYNAERFQGIYNIKPHIINYGIDYDFFSRNDAGPGAQEEQLKGKFIILHVGMLTPYKNQMESLKALNDVKHQIPEAVLVFAGGGYDEAYKQRIDAYIKEHSLSDRVIFKGHISRNELRSLYYKTDVMIHPVKSQGGWLSPFEMLSAGRPIVVSRDLTASYIIEKEEIGIVTGNYARAILDVYKDQNRYRMMAARGREYVNKNLSWDSFGEKMAQLYDMALQPPQR
jgi:glycosyltransferase involved in cell wall biosynthesis